MTCHLVNQTRTVWVFLKEKKMQSKCMHRVVDDDIESQYTTVPDIFDFLLFCCEKL